MYRQVPDHCRAYASVTRVIPISSAPVIMSTILDVRMLVKMSPPWKVLIPQMERKIR